MSWQEKRKDFEFHLCQLLKLCSDRVHHIEIEWNDSDPEYHTLAETVTVYFQSGHSKTVNVRMDSFRAMVLDTITRGL